MKNTINRRNFLGALAAASATAQAIVNHATPAAAHPAPAFDTKPAALGGAAVRKEPFPAWPKFDQREETAMLDVLKSGKWYRGNGQQVSRFEEEYARMMGAKFCLATANGTSSLLTSIMALGIGPGDEVIVPPYTFIATINALLARHALPVFVDTDPTTFQIDARKIETAITDRTVAIMPVHLGGATADLDAILAVAQKHKLAVIEDACQSHLAEWRKRRVGTYGTTGCFSFQASKNLNSGEGGAVLTNDEDMLEKLFTAHNNGRGKRGGYDLQYTAPGLNLRLTEFQASLLLAQMTRIEAMAKTREENAAYLTSMLKEIPGIVPARTYEGCTRNAYHLYMLRYQKEKFAGLERASFLRALRAEGVPASSGYTQLNKEPFLKNTLTSRGYQVIYSPARLKQWEERNLCPANDKLCDEAVWFTQTMLLGTRHDMEQIAEAVRKLSTHAGELTAKMAKG